MRRLKAVSKISARNVLPLNHGLDGNVHAARVRQAYALARQHRIPSLAAAALLITLPGVLLMRDVERARDVTRVDPDDAVVAMSPAPVLRQADPAAGLDRLNLVQDEPAAGDSAMTPAAAHRPETPVVNEPIVPSDPVRYSSDDLQTMVQDSAVTAIVRPTPAPELFAQASAGSPPLSSHGQDRQMVARHGNPSEGASRPVFNGSALIAEARRYLGTNPTKRATLWCGAFLDMVLRRTGHRGGGNLALGYTKYGKRIQGPKVGAIVVLRRNGGGHVGIVTGIDNSGNPIVISGNHNRRVAIATYPRSRVVAYVVP